MLHSFNGANGSSQQNGFLQQIDLDTSLASELHAELPHILVHTGRKIWDSYAPSKSGGQLICGSQYVSISAINLSLRQMMSAELVTEGRFVP